MKTSFFYYLKKSHILVFKEITHFTMLKPTYPKSQPSPLRITTHTIKALFGCSKKNEALDSKPDFKLNLLTLSANLELDDKIRYIEYVTKSDNFIVEFENEELTDEVNISRINNNGKKNLEETYYVCNDECKDSHPPDRRGVPYVCEKLGRLKESKNI